MKTEKISSTSIPATPPKAASNLSMNTRHIITTVLARLQEPQPEGFFTRGLKTVKPGTNRLRLFPILTLTSVLGVLVISFSYYLSQYGNQGFEFFFLLGMLLIFVPAVARLLSPAPLRFERLYLLCVTGLCFYIVELMISPLRFSSFDEFLHWRTADDVLRTGHLFSQNSMLPVSPYYPGLEIVTNTLSTMSGLSTFQAGIVLISASRLLMILSLFLFYERVTKSGRMAGITTVVYMANPHFLLFDAMFGYETFSLPLATFMLYMLACKEMLNRDYRWVLPITWMTLLAISITHHMTDYIFDGVLILWAVVSLFQASARTIRKDLITIAFFGVLLSFAYAFFLPGNPVWGYLSTYFATAFDELGHIIAGASAARPLFTSRGVSPTPIWDRLFMIASIALVSFGLPFGLLSLWKQHRHNALSVALGVISLTYPITQAFRFTNFGTEITDRSAAFLFLPIAYVLTIFITHFWPTRGLGWRATSLITCALSVIMLGGVILEAGPNFSSMPGPYRVSADGRSVELENIQDASWFLSHLGPGNRVGADRVDQMLLSTFGDQFVVTQQDENVDISPVFLSPQFGAEQVAILRQARIRYLVIDLRLSTSLPVLGFYFDSGESGAFQYTSPISRKALTKFDAIPQVNRVFDSGNIVIYDVGALVNG